MIFIVGYLGTVSSLYFFVVVFNFSLCSYMVNTLLTSDITIRIRHANTATSPFRE